MKLWDKFGDLSEGKQFLIAVAVAVFIGAWIIVGMVALQSGGSGPAETSTETTDSVKHGLTEATRQEMYWKVCKVQDGIDPYDPQYNEKNAEAYEVAAQHFGVTVSVVRQVVVEGVQKDWLLP
ncbi:MAG: hypothetical protein L6427_12405 [Actinomycetia bacterium]|nr:hypothetical protein [Planctomycetota bacterium]MCG2796636.1 hypothetical protein [Actinomycetes bacterium]